MLVRTITNLERLKNAICKKTQGLFKAVKLTITRKPLLLLFDIAVYIQNYRGQMIKLPPSYSATMHLSQFQTKHDTN